MNNIRHPVMPPHQTTARYAGELYRRTAEYGCAVDGPHEKRLSVDDKLSIAIGVALPVLVLCIAIGWLG